MRYLLEELTQICDTADEEGMPGCETTREIRNLLDDYPHCKWLLPIESAIEVCENQPVLDYDLEPF